MALSPNVKTGATVAKRLGYLKTATVNGVRLSISSGSWSQEVGPQYTKYAYTPPTGLKQKTYHSPGTKQISWNLSGDVTTESASLFTYLLSPNARGFIFPVSLIQDIPGVYFQYCMFENVTLTGSQNSLITYTLTGKSLSDLSLYSGDSQSTRQHPRASWSSGAPGLKSWTVSHATSLSPHWWNDATVLPGYYRVGDSEFTMNISSYEQSTSYLTDAISISIGSVSMVYSVITNQSCQTGGRTEPMSYVCNLTNVNPYGNAYTPAANVVGGSSSMLGWPTNI